MHTFTTFQPLVDLVFVNHSGGKDSQAATNRALQLFPADKIVLVHAELPGSDWAGIADHIRAMHPGLLLYTTIARYQDGSQKTLLNYVEKRGMWPSSQARYCTSDLKRDPLISLMIKIAKERNARNIISIEGIRADESRDRAKQSPWGLAHKKLNAAGRVVFRYLPIFDWSEHEVFLNIAVNGQKPHPAYEAGMTRLSCCFCVLASKEDLATAASLQPAKLAEIVALEKRTGHTFKNVGMTLDRYIAGVAPATNNPAWEAALDELHDADIDLAA